jgi:hypothetical protein
MFDLPYPPRRSHLTAFWLGMNAMVMAGLLLLLAALGAQDGIRIFLGTLVVVLIAGLAWKPPVLLLYRIWRKGTGIVVDGVRWWVLTVMYFVVFPVVGRGGTRLNTEAAGQAGWRDYEPGSGSDGGTREARMTWLRRVLGETRDRERSWWLPLLPFVLLVSLLHTGEKAEEVPSNIYTLY